MGNDNNTTSSDDKPLLRKDTTSSDDKPLMRKDDATSSEDKPLMRHSSTTFSAASLINPHVVSPKAAGKKDKSDPKQVKSNKSWRRADLTNLSETGLEEHEKVQKANESAYPISVKNNRVTVYGKKGETVVYENRRGRLYGKPSTKATLQAIEAHDPEFYRT